MRDIRKPFDQASARKLARDSDMTAIGTLQGLARKHTGPPRPRAFDQASHAYAGRDLPLGCPAPCPCSPLPPSDWPRSPWTRTSETSQLGALKALQVPGDRPYWDVRVSIFT